MRKKGHIMASEDQPLDPALAGGEVDSLEKEEAAEITGKSTQSDDGVDVQAAPPQPGEHTGKASKIQAKEGLGPPTLERRIAKKMKAVSGLLSEKEVLVLAYIDQRVPYPYCETWRYDTNQNFSLLVRLRHRRQSWSKPPKAS